MVNFLVVSYNGLIYLKHGIEDKSKTYEASRRALSPVGLTKDQDSNFHLKN